MISDMLYKCATQQTMTGVIPKAFGTGKQNEKQ